MRKRIYKQLWAILLPMALGLAPAVAADRVVHVSPMTVMRGESNRVFVVIEALGNENALGLSLCYDTNLLAFVKAVRTQNATNLSGSLNINTSQTNRGRVGMGMALPADSAFPAGSNPAIEVTFLAMPGGSSVSTPVSLCDLPIGREVVDLGARDLGATYEDGVVNIVGSCTYALETNVIAIAGTGGSGSVGVIAGTGCAWTVVNTNDWITMTSGLNGSGNGTVSFAAAGNPGVLARSGTLTIADRLLTVNQAAFACSYSIAPTNRMHGYGAATNSVVVSADPGCAWSVVNPNAWVTITSGSSGTGDGSVSYTLDANPSLDARTGNLTIAGRSYTLLQSGFTCDFKISPTNRQHGASLATNTVSVTASNGCTWSVNNTNSWVTILSGASGDGNGTVTYFVEANPNPVARTGTVVVANELLTLSQQAVICSYKLSPTNRNHGYTAATNSVALTTSSGCSWSVVNSNSWITITSAASGLGNATIGYTLTTNPTINGRTGSVTVADQVFTVAQSGAPCDYAISPNNAVHGAGGGTGLVTVITGSGCAWSVSNTNAWITINSGSSGTGNGSVGYTVAANTGSARAGTVTIAGVAYPVTQAGVLVCTYKISPTNRTHGASAATNTVSVTASNGCTWSVVNTNSWISILSGSGGDGTGTVTYAVEANPNPVMRTGLVLIADQLLTLSQQAVVCAYKLSTTNRSHGYTAATNSVNLTTSSGCAWTVVNNNAWITITSAASGLGNTTVNYVIAANAGNQSRTGVVQVADQMFTLTQAPLFTCDYKISPTNRQHGSSLATNTVSVTVSNGCTWSVDNTNSWVTILSGAGGDGNGTVTYFVEANPNPVARTGTVVIANELLTLSQQAVVCSYKLSTTNRNHGYTAATNTVSLTTSSGCSWTVVNSNSWITITSAASGLGNATIGYTLTTNPTVNGRTGSVTVADQVFTVIQSGAPCEYTLSPTNAVHGVGGGTGLVTVATSSGCPWTVSNTNTWITINSGSSGSGNGSVGYTVAANASTTRAGTVTIAGVAYPVTQAGVLVCTYKISPTNRTHGASAATNTVSVTASNGCTWSVVNTNSWISILSGGGGGSGAGLVTYAVLANEGLLERTGAVEVAGQFLTLIQHGVSCTFSLSPTNRIHGYSAATNSVTFTGGSACAWTVVNTNDWIDITSPLSGTGSGVLSYSVEENPTFVQRTGVVVIAEQTFTLSQRAAPCLFELTPTNRVHGSGSEVATLAVTTSPTCDWTAVTTNPWIAVLVGGAGTGPGEVTYSVEANAGGPARTGHITIGDERFFITQQGVGCTYGVAPQNRVHAGGSETGQVTVTTLAGCPWTVQNTNSWIDAPLSGTGSGTMNYSVDPNPSLSPRSGQLVIAGATFTVTQLGFTCAYKLSPTNRTHGNGSVTGLVSVTTSNGCTWTVSNTNDWITITAGASGDGNGGVGYAVDANLMIEDRVGTFTIGGQPFVLTQRGAPCTLTLVPNDRNHGYGAATGTVAVTSIAGCPWSVVNTNDWIAILSGASGSGNGSFTYAITDNPAMMLRTGVVAVAGETLTLVQAGSPCVYSLSTSARTHGYAAATNAVGVSTLIGCTWRVENTNDWITILSGASGMGTGLVSYAVSANPVIVPRTGVVMIAEEPFTVTQQAAPCTFTLSPTRRTHGFGATNNSFGLTTLAGCGWSVVNPNDWITITSSLSGAGNATISYLVASNLVTIERTGVVMVADELFTITQRAAPCAFAFTPTNGLHDSAAATGTLAVVTSDNCPWSAESTNAWITVIPGPAGLGNGSVTYTLAANPGSAPREGSVLIGGATFPVIQAGAPCSYDLVPTSRLHPATAQTGVVTVVTQDGCDWSIVNLNDWVTILSSTNGPGERSVTYAISANPNANLRSGVLTIAGRTFTVSQVGLACSYTLSATQHLHGATIETGRVDVTTSSGCQWPVVNTNNWITITSGDSGTNSGTVTYLVTANPNAFLRSGTLQIAGQAFVVSQSGAPCRYTLAPTNRVHGATVATGTVSVIAPGGCAWTSSNGVSWITLLSGASGSGTGTVTYAVAANPTSIPRSASMLIAGIVFTVGQAGAGCDYAITPTNAGYGAGSATGLVTVSTLVGCSWETLNAPGWITINTGTNGTGNGTVGYTVAANTNLVPRSATLSIAGQSLVVTQAAAVCSFAINPASFTHGGGLATGTVAVTTLGGCTWSATNTNTWITIAAGATGSGNGTITYTLSTNPTSTARSGLLTIAGQLFTVSQSGTPCHFALAPSSRSHGAGAENGTVGVTAITGCSWTAVPSDSWITISSGGSDVGNGTVSYAVSANTEITARSGTITVDNQVFTLNQAGEACTFTLSPPSWIHRSAAETGIVTFTVHSGCVWTVNNTNSWLTITSSTNGIGSGMFSYSVATNTGTSARAGVVTVGGQPFAVSQGGSACTFKISPTTRLHGFGAVSNSVAVTTTNGCSWSVVNTNDWVTILAGATGTGTGVVNYAVTKNTNPGLRQGVVNIAGEWLTLTQWGTNCDFMVAPLSRSHGFASETGLVTVTASSTNCTWSVANTNTWITINTGAAGTNSGTVGYTVATNASSSPRTGLFTVAGQSFTLTQSGAPCVYALVPTIRSHGAGSETGLVTVAVVAGCVWNASTTNTWITFTTGTGGTGAGSFGYSIGANPSSLGRTGAVTVADQTFTLTQTGAACSYVLSPTNANHVGVSSTGLVTVTAVAGCNWTVSNPNSWIIINSGASGTGNGTIGYTVTANPTGTPRSGTLSVGGQAMTVNQAGADCAYILLPTSRAHGSGVESGSLSVTALSGCTWTVDNTNTWIQITSGSAGNGSGTVGYSLLGNPTLSSRSGDVRIGGQIFTITQAGLTCSYAIAPSSRSHGVGLETGTISVTASNVCAWSVSNANSWIVINSGASGTGNGTVNYTVSPNSGASRSGTILVAGLPFAVTQSGLVRMLRAVDLSIPRGQTNILRVVLESKGDENALGFSLGYDTNLLTFLKAVRGTDATNASAQLNVNTNQVAASGRLGFGLALPTDVPFQAGDRTILEVHFRAAAGTTFATTSVTNADRPILREVVDVNAGELTTSYKDAVVTLLGDCAYTLGATGASFGDAGGPGSVSVTANSACAWTVSNSNAWITVTSSTNGLGNGTVNFTVASNPSPTLRTGVLTIAGRIYTVNQSGITCTYALTPTNRIHGALSETGLVTVVAAGGCPWAVNNTNGWITISTSTNGSGNGSFGYAIQANPSISARTGLVQVATQFYTVIQPGASCNYGLVPTGRAHGYNVETGLVTVTALAGCAWTTVNTNSWVTINTGTSGIGNGSVGYSVAINPTSTARAGVVVIGGQSFLVSQAANICDYSIAPTNRTHGYASESGTVAVITGSGCPWSVANTNSWITLNSGASGTGNGAVNYTVTFNASGTVRTGVLVIGGQPFFVTQAGSPCAYAIAPSERNHGAGVESGTISLATFGGCGWSVTTSNSWISITAGRTGTGSGSISYTLNANPGGPSRTGLVVVTDTDLSFKIIQLGQPCAFSLSASNRAHGFGAEGSSVVLTAVEGCPWSIVNSNTWITITSGLSGASGTNVTYTVAANPTGISRTGVVTIAEQLLTVTQAGAPCNLAISPTNRVHGSGATTGTLSVTGLPGCGWTVSTASPWITITSPANGSGTGTVSYAVGDNLNAAGRTGVVSIAGLSVTLIQSGATCTYVVSPTNRVHGQGLVSASLTVSSITGCVWTVNNTNPWITIVSSTNGSGNGTVDYQVNPNISAFMRTGLVFIAGQVVTLIQSETPCSYTLLPTSRLHTGSSETGTVTVTTIPGCAWSVNNPNSWITITSGASGSSNGIVTYVVAANPSTVLRSGVFTLGGQSFTVTQEGLPCRYQLNPAFSLLTSGNVTGLVSVTTSIGCSWLTENTNAWIAIKSGEAGTGNGLVRFTAAPNPNPSARTGNLIIGGEVHPVTQLGAPCTYQLSATNRTLASGSETGMVSVFTSSECIWSTINTNSWITITSGTNGSGNATVGYALSPNPTAGDRTGVIGIGGANATVNYVITQFGSSCSYALTPPDRLHGPGLETGMVFVTAVTGCTWTVTKTNTWITINSGLNGTNNGVVTYTVAVNASPTQRSTVLTIGGAGGGAARSFVVTQDGVLCEFAITPTNGVHGFAAGTGVVRVATSNVCPWIVNNTNSWITIASGTNGTGNADVTYTMTFNPSPSPRTGSITIAGQPYIVTQSGITCTYALTPTVRAHDFNAGTGVVSVATSNLCTWTVSNSNSWITINSATIRSNSGTVGYSFTANPVTPSRVGVINIAGQPFTVTQFGIPFNAPSNRTVECGTPWTFEPPTLSGTCSNIGMILIVSSTVTNVVCGNARNATRTWDATDGCGNHLVLTQMVKVVVTSPPLLFCGLNKNVECGANWTFDPPTASDGCGGTNISIRVVSTVTNKVGACGNTFVAIRTWEAADGCSNTATCLQVVSVLDRTAPFLACAANRVVECGTAWTFTAPTASDACGTNIAIQILSTVTNNAGACGATFIATRIWEATDSCSNRTSCSQSVSVVDTTAPVLTCGASKVVECGLGWSFDAPSASDTCGAAGVSVAVVSTVTNTADFCGGTYSVVRTWEATDSCSNKSTCAQTVRVADTTVPILGCRANKVVEFGLTWNFDLPTMVDGCSNTGLTLRVVATVTNTVGFCGNTFSATRFWEAADACSNRSALCSQTVKVADTTAPFFICPTNKSVRCNQPWSFDVPTAFDLAAGSNVTITVVSTITNGTCGNGFVVTRTWEAVDNCTNKSACIQVVTGASEITLGGTVSYATNYPMAGASERRLEMVPMSLTGGTNMSTHTDASGAFRFTVNASGTCVLAPKLTNSTPVANGVSTLDISLIRRHILNIALLDSPYKLLAADVNGSRTVSTLDLTFIRRMILTPTNPLPSGLWRFVPSDYTFANPQSPWDAPTNRSYTGLMTDLSGQDFFAIKMGDVNNSWTPPVTASGFAPAGVRTALGSGPDVHFQLSHHTNQPGDVVVTKVTARGLREVTSAQWTLAWNPTVLRFKSTADYGLRGLAAGNFGTDLAGEGKLTFSWDDPDALGVTAADGTTVFSASFEVVGEAGTASPVSLVDTAAEREVGVKFAPASLRSEDGQVFVTASALPTLPQLKQPLYVQGSFGVPLATVTGKTYILEYTDALPSTNWIALPAVTGDGTIKTLSDPSPNTRQRFYRVRIQ